MHFLCGIDTSAGAPAVAHVAAQLARRMGAELTLAHVASTSDRPASARTPFEASPRDAQGRGEHAHELDALADDIAAAFGARPEVCAVQDDTPAAGLATAARALACDLVIIGSTSRGRVASLFRAGTRDALVAQAGCPVMVVPPGAVAPTGDRVAVAYETFGASRGAAAVAARLASALDGRLTVIHALPDPRSYTRSVLPMHRDVRRVIESTLDGEELDLRHVSAYRLPAAHLAQTVAEVQPSLLVVAAPERANWRNPFQPSMAARLLRGASCPVVVVAEGAAIGAKRTIKVAASA